MKAGRILTSYICCPDEVQDEKFDVDQRYILEPSLEERILGIPMIANNMNSKNATLYEIQSHWQVVCSCL